MPILSHTPESILCTQRGERATIGCDHCGVEFVKKAKFVRADLKRGRRRFFCSTRCRTEGASKTPAGFSCTNCGKEVHRRQDPKSRHSFCSSSCSALYSNRVNPREVNPRKKRSRSVSDRFALRTHMEFETAAERPKQPRPKQELITMQCEGCGEEVRRTQSQLGRTKHGKPYCSKSCRMRHYNHHILTATGHQRSGPEDMLLDHIRTDFPALEIRPNDRTHLPSGLEIDIHIPLARLAIELNGPVHYLPIYGEDRFRRSQAKDAQKHLEIHDCGLSLLVLDISRLHSKKQQREFIAKHYKADVKPLLMEAGGGVSPAHSQNPRHEAT